MRNTSFLVLAAILSATSGVAVAGEATYLTPPLFREQARDTQKVRSVSDLTTTPTLTTAAKPTVPVRAVQVVADAEASSAR
ncbi:hypothetical protein ASF28_03185 [Methylobacterium sp. Leaf99]|jgi:hypothetical protein|uniref:hypothetical protein n=1 Tax=Methylobacterium sp. Leaf99 TaxID=1736251 RepID=UPI0006FE882C|nr:hypothetical protein [Methylobacterium sp. Leaf99]KQP10173.1 hypothetical protein ASF28_03185 [Methylobacterium sp. Leaf99]